jgi:hypothetical protein
VSERFNSFSENNKSKSNKPNRMSKGERTRGEEERQTVTQHIDDVFHARK